METRRGVVTRGYQRMYDDPIVMRAGDVVRVTKRELWNDDERYPWLWCIDAQDKAGWTPEHFVEVQGEHGTALRDYNAIELSVQEGETVQLGEEANGWFWSTNQQGKAGWVPITHITLL